MIVFIEKCSLEMISSRQTGTYQRALCRGRTEGVGGWGSLATTPDDIYSLNIWHISFPSFDKL